MRADFGSQKTHFWVKTFIITIVIRHEMTSPFSTLTAAAILEEEVEAQRYHDCQQRESEIQGEVQHERGQQVELFLTGCCRHSVSSVCREVLWCSGLTTLAALWQNIHVVKVFPPSRLTPYWSYLPFDWLSKVKRFYIKYKWYFARLSILIFVYGEAVSLRSQ